MRQTKILSLTSLSAISKGFCKLPLAPAGRWPFPTLSPRSLHGCLDPYPAVFPRCFCLFLPGEHRPHLSSKKFGTLTFPCNATSTGGIFRGCSHSIIFRLLRLLDSLVAPTFSSEVAEPFTPRRTWLVACSKLWHRYACDTSNSCDRTCTGWISALSAAPSA